MSIFCPSGHGLLSSSSKVPWVCDAQKEPGGCKCNNQTIGKARWTCDKCDFDYCGPCYDAKMLLGSSSTSSLSKVADLYKSMGRGDIMVMLVERGILSAYNSATDIQEMVGMLIAYDGRHGTSVPKLRVRWVGPFAAEWTCARCDEACYVETCPRCDVKKNIVGMAHMHPIFDKAEKMYFEIIDCHLEHSHLNSSPAAKSAKFAELKSKVTQVLGSSDINDLQNRNWSVRPFIERLLSAALDLSLLFSSATPMILDTNSESLFIAFVKRVHEQHKERYNVPKSELLLSLENPSKEITKWTCPLCLSEQGTLEEDCHSCKVNSQTFKLMFTSSQQRNRDSIKSFSRLCFKGFDLNLGLSSAQDASKSPKTLRQELLVELKDFLDSSESCMHFEDAGFLIRRHFDAFFCRLLKGERSFPWIVNCYVEQNSVALYAYFIRALNKEVADNPRYRGKILVDSPRPVKDIDEEFDSTFSQGAVGGRTKRSKECDRFLYQSSRMLSHICRAIAYSASSVDWSQLGRSMDNMKSRFSVDITPLVDLLKINVRDYDTLVKDLLVVDEDRRCIAEALLHRVVSLELTRVTENVFNIDVSSVVIDTSLFTQAEAVSAVAPVDYITIETINLALSSIKKHQGLNNAINTLETILKNIIDKPTDEKFREININNYFKQHIGSVPGGLDFLSAIGFKNISATKLKLPSTDLKLIYIGYDKVKALKDMVVVVGGGGNVGDALFSDDFVLQDVLLCLRGSNQTETSDTIYYDEASSRITLLSISDGLSNGGTLAPCVSGLSRLQYLHLSHPEGSARNGGTSSSSSPFSIGGICGRLPSSLDQLQCLVEINLGGNKLEGEIPASIGNLVNLTLVSLESNQFSGVIPASFGNLIKVEKLKLDNNKLSGAVPSTLGNLVHIKECNLSNNHFKENSLPMSFGNFKKLTFANPGIAKSCRSDSLDIFKVSFDMFSLIHVFDKDPALLAVSKDVFDYLCEDPRGSQDQNPFSLYDASIDSRRSAELLFSLNQNKKVSKIPPSIFTGDISPNAGGTPNNNIPPGTTAAPQQGYPGSDSSGETTPISAGGGGATIKKSSSVDGRDLDVFLPERVAAIYLAFKYKYYQTQFELEDEKAQPVDEHMVFLFEKLNSIEAKLPGVEAISSQITSLLSNKEDLLKELMSLRKGTRPTDPARQRIQAVIDDVLKLKIGSNGDVSPIGDELGQDTKQLPAAQTPVLQQSSDRPVMINWNDLEVVEPALNTELGKGSYGRVYRARYKSKGVAQPVAVKVLHLDFPFEHNREAALQEYKMVVDANRRIKCKDSIISIIGLAEGYMHKSFEKFYIGAANTKVCAIIMRLEAGGSLKDLMKTEKWRVMSNLDKLDIVSQIARGLTELHEIGIVHGDIKPANILLNHTWPPIVRLCDFGQAITNRLASLSDTSVNSQSAFKESLLIQTPTNRGSPVYSAPELLLSKLVNGQAIKPTRSTDMYSFGILSWEMLCKDPLGPFADAKTEFELMTRVAKNNERPDINKLLKGIPPEVRDMIVYCWDQERAKRHKALQCYSILDQVYNQLSTKMYDIFLSHPWVMKPVMRHVKRLLNLLGYKVWYDEINMQWDLRDSMREGISKSKVVLACICPAFEKSKFCMFELVQAKTLNKAIFVLATEAHPFLDIKTGAPGWAGKITAHGNVCDLCDMGNHLFLDIGDVCAMPGWETDDDSLIPVRNLEALRDKVDKLVEVLQCGHSSCFPSGSPANSPANSL